MRVQDIPLIAVIKIVGVLYLKLGDVESEFIVLNSITLTRFWRVTLNFRSF